MNLIDVSAVATLLFALGAGAGALVQRVMVPIVAPGLRTFAPSVRTRWLVALLATPSAFSILALLVPFGPCLRNLLLGLPDGCRGHGGPQFFFCLRTPMGNVPVAWALAAALLILATRRLTVGLGTVIRAERALAMLRSVGRWDGSRGAWLVPGALAMVAGFPRARVYLGE